MSSTANRAGVLASRIRIPVLALGGLLAVAGLILGLAWVSVPGIVLVLLGLLLYFRLGRVETEPIPVRPPVKGRWAAVNSPADGVPSHGIHAYGQTYAIDFVHSPAGRYEVKPDWSFRLRPPDDYSGFGEPVFSPVDGTVVKVSDGARDHRSRDSWPGLGYFFAEGSVRELAGPGRLLGNHVTIEKEPGVYAVLAHLKRHSTRVEPGQRVEAGQEIAACGNSGSSTEPHLHFQLMDRESPVVAAGLPFELTEGEGGSIPTPGAGMFLDA